MKTESIALLGSTGSIGTQALDVCRKLGIRVAALTANRNIDLLEAQIREYCPLVAAVADERAALELRSRVRDVRVTILAGVEGVCEAAATDGADTVLNAIVGMAGLRPTLAAIGAKKTLALANKESLVTGGAMVMEQAAANGVRILPVDSEHSAIFQCLQGCADAGRELSKIILTASGGPFFGYSRGQLAGVTPEQALRHPNWSMGAKITIDCATMMNKGLELIEAVWLFGLPPEKVQVTVHRQSIIHSAVEFADHAVLAQLGVPDMRIPIQYALTYPERVPSPAGALDLFTAGPLTFDRPDEETFRCLAVCRRAIARGGLVPAAANGANEQAVALFLQKKIGFNDIGDLVAGASERQSETESVTLGHILEADRRARSYVLQAAGINETAV